MAQIAHYPGPDEPLYVPAEGEQIWLTDLEGHADIYDNDSIKINYAPGFDKSQITRIDVYRNGVKLRFVPALFDVLTNEQMKTFDGNPAENTPEEQSHGSRDLGVRVRASADLRISWGCPNRCEFRGDESGAVLWDLALRKRRKLLLR